MTDPAVEALAEVLAASGFGPQDPADRDWPLDIARATLDHIAAHLHDDTPEGVALRERLGLEVDTERMYGCPMCYSNPTDRHECVEVEYRRLVSPWRDA